MDYRESEWSFGTPAGRKQFFLEHLNYNRITFIMLSRECTYTTWKDISVELTEALGRFAPGNATSKKVGAFWYSGEHLLQLY